MEFYMKIYKVEREVLVAVCDSNIRGKIFEEGEVRLEVSEEFYGDELYSREEVAEALRQATIANLSGKESVALGIEVGIIDRENVLRVKGVPHAQFARL